MKKTCFAAAFLLLALICFSPLALILCSILGLHFDLTRPVVLSSTIALAAIVALLVSIDRGEVDKVSSVLLVLAAPLSMIGAISVLLSEHSSLWDLLLLSAAVLVCLFLGFRFGSPKWLKIVVMTISMLIFIPLLYLWPAFIIGSAGEVSVVQAVESPDGEYRAELIDDDQGAMGGSTRVDIYRGKTFDAWFFRVGNRKTLYIGDWGEYDRISMVWDGDACLLIDGKPYPNPFLD